jgi:protein SCO1/2
MSLHNQPHEISKQIVMSIFSRPAAMLGLLLLFLNACSSPEVVYDLSDASFDLVDQNGRTVEFPGDFEGELLVVGFIYTHCPDVCSIITANMINTYNGLEDTSGIHFVGITFDPQRDTPPVLKRYAQNFKLDEGKFTLLTGSPAVVDSLLTSLDIRAEISDTLSTASGQAQYVMNHTNRIVLMDEHGRVRMEHPGSMVPPKILIEDLQTLR